MICCIIVLSMQLEVYYITCECRLSCYLEVYYLSNNDSFTLPDNCAA
jgi:hypothetical protein